MPILQIALGSREESDALRDRLKTDDVGVIVKALSLLDFCMEVVERGGQVLVREKGDTALRSIELRDQPTFTVVR